MVRDDPWLLSNSTKNEPSLSYSQDANGISELFVTCLFLNSALFAGAYKESCQITPMKLSFKNT